MSKEETVLRCGGYQWFPSPTGVLHLGNVQWSRIYPVCGGGHLLSLMLERHGAKKCKRCLRLVEKAVKP